MSIMECGLRVPTTWNRPGARRTRVSPVTRACELVISASMSRSDGIEVLALVQPVAVEAAELVLPERLPLGEHQLLQLAVRADEQQRGAGLEADPALDAERGLAHVDVAADAVGLARARPAAATSAGPASGTAVERDGQAPLPAEDDLARRRARRPAARAARRAGRPRCRGSSRRPRWCPRGRG